MALENIKGEIEMGLRLLAFRPLQLELAPMKYVEDAMKANGLEAITGIVRSGDEFSRYYYSSAQKTYAHVVCNAYTGAAEIKAADEAEMLESMSFPELQHLGNLIDKKSVNFIRIYSQKELAAAASEEELRALKERNEKMVAEAEVALRKR